MRTRDRKRPAIRAAIYTRVSTGRQERDMQLRECRTQCRRAGWRVIGEFTDAATGARRSRPGLDALLAQCKLRKVDIVVVWKLDRLSRSLTDLLNTAEDLTALGVNLVSLHDQIDTTTPSGKALFQLVGVFAEFERGIMQERIRAGLEAARSRGVRLGRPPTDPRRVQAARAIMKRGHSLRQAAKQTGIPASTLSRALKKRR
jgi:DNA invertase Pin-like site-specific DNA recombinase